MSDTQTTNGAVNRNERICDFCYCPKPHFYSLYKIVLKTNKAIYEIGMITLVEKLGDWAMRKMLHISASQIILLRPDILHDFFKEEHKDQIVLGWFLKEHCMCFQCYEQYKEHVPVR